MEASTPIIVKFSIRLNYLQIDHEGRVSKYRELPLAHHELIHNLLDCTKSALSHYQLQVDKTKSESSVYESNDQLHWESCRPKNGKP